MLYRPSDNKLKNSKTKDYLGKAVSFFMSLASRSSGPPPYQQKLVAASDSNDAFTEFTGVKKLQQASEENLDNKDDENKSDAELSRLSRSATAPVPRTSFTTC